MLALPTENTDMCFLPLRIEATQPDAIRGVDPPSLVARGLDPRVQLPSLPSPRAGEGREGAIAGSSQVKPGNDVGQCERDVSNTRRVGSTPSTQDRFGRRTTAWTLALAIAAPS